MRLTEVIDFIKSLFKKMSRMIDHYSETSDSDCPPPKNKGTDPGSEKKEFSYKRSRRPRKGKNTSVKNTSVKDTSVKDIMLVILTSGTILIFSGCSKNQDVKIVHNYWDRPPSCSERKQQAHLDLYVYKKFKDLNGKETITIYKAD